MLSLGYVPSNHQNLVILVMTSFLPRVANWLLRRDPATPTPQPPPPACPSPGRSDSGSSSCEEDYFDVLDDAGATPNVVPVPSHAQALPLVESPHSSSPASALVEIAVPTVSSIAEIPKGIPRLTSEPSPPQPMHNARTTNRSFSP